MRFLFAMTITGPLLVPWKEKAFLLLYDNGMGTTYIHIFLDTLLTLLFGVYIYSTPAFTSKCHVWFPCRFYLFSFAVVSRLLYTTVYLIDTARTQGSTLVKDKEKYRVANSRYIFEDSAVD